MHVSFTHLEVHSHFTLLAGTASVAELVARASADGMTHLALTDTNALYGAVAFARACREAGIQPIIGMTVTIAEPRGRQVPLSSSEWLAPPPAAPVQVPVGSSPEPRPGIARHPASPAPAGHLVLLATGPSGYRSLCQLTTVIQRTLDRAAVAARGLDWDTLQAHREGLICLSGGRMGWVDRYLRAGDTPAAQQYAGKLANVFDGAGYLAIEVHQPEDYGVAREILTLGARLGMPVVAVQPVYCLEVADAPRLRLLAAIRYNCPLDAVPSEALPGGDQPGASFDWLSPEQVATRFEPFPAAPAATSKIAARCEPALPDGRPIWPALKLTSGHTPDQELATLARASAESKYRGQPVAQVEARLDDELAAIARHGYAPLFLVVADIVRYARSKNIPVSTRGSVANSLVAYCTGITTIDPIEHGLLFERFLNPARAVPPDIDLDLCSRRRDEVLAYVRDTYGPERVALIGTHSTMRPRSAVREAGKAYGLPDTQIERIAAVLPRGWHPDPRRRDKRTLVDVLAELEDSHLRDVARAAYGLVGQPDHLSVHPGGIVITPGPLTDIVPVQWAPKGFLVTQYEHDDVEALGLPKIDLLGIRALTVLADTTEMVRRHYDANFVLEAIPLGDPLAGDLLERGDTIGVFQCESEGARRTLRKLRARTVADLAVANAFFKPGPATGGMARAFVRRYRGEERVTFLHPALAPILGPTKGVLIFQEQILRVAREIAGLSWEHADRLRRGMSKFLPEEMDELRDQFLAGCQRLPPDGPALTAAQATTLWEQVMAFAGYGFNQGHAAAYADVSYRSAYLKAHWPAAFLCARLADWGGFHHPAVYMAEALRLGVALRAPHVNYSGEHFLLTLGDRPLPISNQQSGLVNQQSATLWMGLGAVRDLRHSSTKRIVAERAKGQFTSLRDLLSRVDLLAKEIAHLIQCGALDGLGESRAALLAEAEMIRKAGTALQMNLFFDQPQVAGEPAAQRLDWEQQVLGLPVSVHPLALVAERLPKHVPLRQLSLSGMPGQMLTIAGVRLPGWTGGPGFFFGDGDSFVIVRGLDKAPAVWQPAVCRGRWLDDGYGTTWFQAQEASPVR